MKQFRHPMWVGICAVALISSAACNDDEPFFAGIARTSADSPDLIGPDDPEDWQPRCTSSWDVFCVAPAFPNPTSAGTTISFFLQDSSLVELFAESEPRNKVRAIASLDLQMGPWQVFWDLQDDSGAQLPNGIYRVWIKVIEVSEGTIHETFGDVQIQRP